MASLDEGMKVQESSANLMSFLIQDLLDFAQIRAGKFRKNFKQFNIRDAIEQVMCIQRQNVNQDEIQFFASYENILQHDNQLSNELIVKSDSSKQFSPLINTDK